MITHMEPGWTKLTHTQADDFSRDGFVIVRNALNPDQIVELITMGDELVASDRELYRQRSGRSDGFRNMVAIDDRVRELLTNPLTFPLVVQLMGPHLQLHTSHLIWKEADPEGTSIQHRCPGWHRDVSRMTQDIDDAHMPRVEIKVAYFLSDCSHPHHGQTMVVPGSHRWNEPWHGTHGSDPQGAFEPRLAAGDALLFENRTWHAGGVNLSGRTRKTLMIGYSHRWMRPDDYDWQDDALLERCTPLERVLLDVKQSCYNAQGNFQAVGKGNALEAWAQAHGYRQPACH